MPPAHLNYLEAFLTLAAFHPQLDIHVRYLGIVSKPHVSESIRSYRLLEERAVLVTRAQSKLKEIDVPEAPFVSYSRSDALLDHFFKTHFPRMELGRVRRLSTVNSHLLKRIETHFTSFIWKELRVPEKMRRFGNSSKSNVKPLDLASVGQEIDLLKAMEKRLDSFFPWRSQIAE